MNEATKTQSAPVSAPEASEQISEKAAAADAVGREPLAESIADEIGQKYGTYSAADGQWAFSPWEFIQAARDIADAAIDAHRVPATSAAALSDVKDAARYRWFKDNYLKHGNSDPDIRRPIVLFEGRWYGGHFDNMDDLDVAIDEAMQDSRPAKGAGGVS